MADVTLTTLELEEFLVFLLGYAVCLPDVRCVPFGPLSSVTQP